MEVFQIRNQKAWDAIEAEKKIQAQLKKEAGLDKPCCAISPHQRNTAMMLEEIGNELLHKIPKGKEIQYLEDIMVSCNTAISELMREY